MRSTESNLIPGSRSKKDVTTDLLTIYFVEIVLFMVITKLD